MVILQVISLSHRSIPLGMRKELKVVFLYKKQITGERFSPLPSPHGDLEDFNIANILGKKWNIGLKVALGNPSHQLLHCTCEQKRVGGICAYEREGYKGGLTNTHSLPLGHILVLYVQKAPLPFAALKCKVPPWSLSWFTLDPSLLLLPFTHPSVCLALFLLCPHGI